MTMVCTLALVLLLDASASIRASDWQTQVEGHAVALEDQANTLARQGPVALTVLAFSDLVSPMVQWRLIQGPEQARAVARELRQRPRPFLGGTDIPHALRTAHTALGAAPCTPEREVIDLVTDGEDVSTPTARERDRLQEAGVTVNALGVGSPAAANWLRNYAVTRGGFVLQVESWRDFPAAIRRKITLELAGLTP